jgi:hypothetical protein
MCLCPESLAPLISASLGVSSAAGKLASPGKGSEAGRRVALGKVPNSLNPTSSSSGSGSTHAHVPALRQPRSMPPLTGAMQSSRPDGAELTKSIITTGCAPRPATCMAWAPWALQCLHPCECLEKLIKMPALVALDLRQETFFLQLLCVHVIAPLTHTIAFFHTMPLFALGSPSQLSLMLSLPPWPLGVVECSL